MTTERTTSTDARRAFVDALERGDARTVARAVRTLLGPAPTVAAASFVRRAVDKAPQVALLPLRVAFLSSFSSEFIHDAAAALAATEGLRLEIYQAGFGQFRQEILAPDSGLYAFAPDVVVLALEGKDLVPAVYAPDGLTAEGGGEALVAEAGQELAMLVETFRKSSSATLLIHNFAPPTWRRLGILDGHLGTGQAEQVAALNSILARVCRESRGVYAVDYAGLVQRHGALTWYDDRMAHYARAPIAQAVLPRLGAEYLKFLRAVTGKTRKCLVLDLDNTLWGGVVGEDGVSGIQLGPDYPGSAFVEFQRAVRGLHQRGVILAVASKNNPADVDEVFANHPHMALRRDDFAVLRVGWGSKSQSIEEIARHLNIGLDHVVFVDDNPVECDEVGHALPGVTVLHLPSRPEHFVRALLEPGYFDSLGVSDEDRRRGELYAQRDQAEELRAASASLEDFYRRLDMEVVFAPVTDESLPRSAQLTQKTNQFTVTTIRYSEAEMQERRADPAWLLSTVQVRDRFGDNGIVGVMMARTAGEDLEIDTFLMSCRVIGRTVETAMLAYLCEHAAKRGLSRVRGRIVPTAKNAPVRDLYQRHGLRLVSGQEDSETTWVADLDTGAVRYPEWLRIVAEPAS